MPPGRGGEHLVGEIADHHRDRPSDTRRPPSHETCAEHAEPSHRTHLAVGSGFLTSFIAWNIHTSERLTWPTASGPKYSDSLARPAFLPRLSPVSTQSRIATGAG